MCGYDMGYVRLAQPYLDTTAVNTVTWCISSQCKNPDKALDFLNLTYTDPDVVNLIVFGLEGRDYVKVSDREMVSRMVLMQIRFPIPHSFPVVW